MWIPSTNWLYLLYLLYLLINRLSFCIFCLSKKILFIRIYFCCNAYVYRYVSESKAIYYLMIFLIKIFLKIFISKLEHVSKILRKSIFFHKLFKNFMLILTYSMIFNSIIPEKNILNFFRFYKNFKIILELEILEI